MKRLFYAVTIVFFAGATPSWAGDEMRALVTDVVGDVSPEIYAFDEVPKGTVLDLGKGAELSLTFYPNCSDVTLRGGKVTIGDDTISTSDTTELLSQAKGDCPGAVKLTETDIINAAVISRSRGKALTPRVNPRPVFGVSGVKGARYDRLLIRDGRRTLVEIPMAGRTGAWPVDAAPLEDGRTYALALVGIDVKPYVAKVVLSADAPELLVLRQ